MKIVSWNVNGIRSVYDKGFSKWMKDLDPDIVCLQETKALSDQLTEDVKKPESYGSHWHSALKKGYSGVMIYTKKEPLSLQIGLGDPSIDTEGRVLTAEYPSFFVINAYFPNSQRDHSRLGYKLDFCKKMLAFLESKRAEGKNLLLCGDFNIAHKAIDLKNPKANEKNAGYLPEERAWFEELVQTGYVDAFRLFNQGPEQYTWWSYRPTIRERNIGWRLDYFVANPEFQARIKNVEHQSSVRGSDHCPVLLTLKK